MYNLFNHAACPKELSQASVAISVCGKEFSVLNNAGSSDSFISEQVVKHLKLCTHLSSQNISIAVTTLNAHFLGHCFINFILNGVVYSTTQLGVLKTSAVT